MADPLALLKAASGGLPEVAEVAALPAADKHSLCLQVLTDGYVQSFVDFFYLTHKPDTSASHEDEEPSSEPDRLVLPAEHLEFVRASLCEAEAARRQSETKAVFGSYHVLAELFATMTDYKTSVYFREKCLEISKLVADVEGELVASRELGVAHEKLGNVPESIKFYEKAHQLAQGDPVNQAQATRDLVMAYQAYARLMERSGDLPTALAYHQRCLQGAQESEDKSLAGNAHYYLGQCLELVQEPAQAIDHYSRYLDLCKQGDDNDGQGAAAFALASAYQQTGDTASAVTQLEAFIDLAQGTGQVRLQAEACNSLGVIHSKQGDARSAVHYFERFFELARSLGDHKLIDKARVNLGIARGNLVMGAYVQVVTSDLDALLKWKNRRIPFAEVAPRHEQ
mmetsp:Transcript_43990/g.108920  ORF Transcript_43990/g.108920 Transcript_43990/m.108920 type:complete len:397 (+) Transcript_43990:1-1191(+)